MGTDHTYIASLLLFLYLFICLKWLFRSPNYYSPPPPLFAASVHKYFIQQYAVGFHISDSKGGSSIFTFSWHTISAKIQQCCFFHHWPLHVHAGGAFLFIHLDDYISCMISSDTNAYWFCLWIWRLNMKYNLELVTSFLINNIDDIFLW